MDEETEAQRRGMTCPRSPCLPVLFSHRREVNREPSREGKVNNSMQVSDVVAGDGGLGKKFLDGDKGRSYIDCVF